MAGRENGANLTFKQTNGFGLLAALRVVHTGFKRKKININMFGNFVGIKKYKMSH